MRGAILTTLLSLAVVNSHALNESRSDQTEQDLKAVFERHHPKNDTSYHRVNPLERAPFEAFKDHMGIVHYEEGPRVTEQRKKEVFVRHRGKGGRLDMVIMEYPADLQGEHPGRAIIPGKSMFTRWDISLEHRPGQPATLHLRRTSLKVMSEHPIRGTAHAAFGSELKTDSGKLTFYGMFSDIEASKPHKGFLGEIAAKFRELEIWQRPLSDWPLDSITAIRPFVRILPELLRKTALRV